MFSFIIYYSIRHTACIALVLMRSVVHKLSVTYEMGWAAGYVK